MGAGLPCAARTALAQPWTSARLAVGSPNGVLSGKFSEAATRVTDERAAMFWGERADRPLSGSFATARVGNHLFSGGFRERNQAYLRSQKKSAIWEEAGAPPTLSHCVVSLWGFESSYTRWWPGAGGSYGH